MNTDKNLTISTFQKIHESSVIKLILSIQRDEFSVDITQEDQPDLIQIESFYQSGNGNFWVAQIGSEIVGTIALLDISDSHCVIRKMFVKAQYRGQDYQVAQQLLDIAILWCKAADVKSLSLGTIDKYKAAHKFYEKNNFKQCRKHHLPQSFPFIAVDNVFYQRHL